MFQKDAAGQETGPSADDQRQDYRRRSFGAASALFSGTDLHPEWSPMQHFVFELVDSKYADCLMGFFITTNSIFVVLETNVNGQGLEMPTWLSVSSAALSLIYIVELVARLFVYRGEFFSNTWHLFDFFVVTTDVLSEILGRLFQNAIPSVSVLRIFRILRLLRFVEFLTIFGELHMMVQLMISSIRTMFWGTVLLVVVLTLWSIIAVEFLNKLVKELAEQGEFEGCERCPRAFETVYQSTLTFFQVLIFGDSWGQISVVLIEAHPWTAFILVFAGISVQVWLLNLILTVIVDKAHEQHEHDAARRLKAKERQYHQIRDKLLKICEVLDTDNSGDLELSELMEGFETNHEFALALSLMDIKMEDMGVVFSILDEDGSGAVSYTEFVDQLHKMKSQDSHTMLLFIKGYVNELRLKMDEQIKIMQTEVTSKVEQILINQQAHEMPSKVANGHSDAGMFSLSPDKPPQIPDDYRSLFEGLMKQLNVMKTEMTEKLENHERHAVGHTELLAGFSSILTGRATDNTAQPLGFFQACSVSRPSRPGTPMTPVAAHRLQ